VGSSVASISSNCSLTRNINWWFFFNLKNAGRGVELAWLGLAEQKSHQQGDAR
jgi:hypothetical protein